MLFLIPRHLGGFRSHGPPFRTDHSQGIWGPNGISAPIGGWIAFERAGHEEILQEYAAPGYPAMS